MKEKARRTVSICLVSLLFLWIVFPYVKAEYYTARYGDELRDEFWQIGWLDAIEYCKIIDYSNSSAIVIYVEKNHETTMIAYFADSNGKWILQSWDAIYSRSGNAEQFMWPYYR